MRQSVPAMRMVGVLLLAGAGWTGRKCLEPLTQVYPPSNRSRWVFGCRVLLGSILASGVPAGANDSVGHLSAGGITLARSADIEIRQEELRISMNEIRVRYRFFNKSDKAVDTLVAFPVPDLPSPSDVEFYTVPRPEHDNFLGFQTTVNGQSLDMRVERRAVALGIDHTDRLRELGLPLTPYAKAAEEAIAALSPEVRNELAGLGVLREEEFSNAPDGSVTIKHLPNWTMRSTYYWQQVFPSRNELLVEHRYIPSVGASAGTTIGSPDASPEMLAEYGRRYCFDDAFLSAAARAQKSIQRREGATLMERRVAYILSTGANWAGPIRDFRLIVDKGSDRNLVSLCGQNVKKISATSFEMRATDYWPEGNIELLILEPSEESRE